MPGVVEGYLRDREHNLQMEAHTVSQMMNQMVKERPEITAPEMLKQYVSEYEAGTSNIETLRQSREQTAKELSRLHIHPEQSRPKEYKRFGELSQTDRKIKRIELADRVADYAEQHLKQAEGKIGSRLAEAIRQGESAVDLKQDYEGVGAKHRHEIALMNLDGFIQQAEKLGVKIDRGEAITVGQEERMKIAI